MFRLRRVASKWFKNIEKDLPYAFDIYYFCLMAGLSANRKKIVPTVATVDIVPDFPGDYKDKGPLIISLFISRELEALGINKSERDVLYDSIKKLIDSSASSRLSDLGFNEINKYSFGGFDVITEWFLYPPHTLGTFLIMYKEYIDKEINKEY